MSSINVDLPESLHEQARGVAAARNLSMDALIAMALAQSLSRLVPDTQLEKRAARSTGKGISEFIAQVPDANPDECDSLPEGYRRK